jgi:peptidoglycan/xylan/chitin deacetylase (PgdA/CDA1 family)
MISFPKNQYYGLLSGRFEPQAQSNKVPDYAYSPLNQSGELYRPVIDQSWVHDHAKPVWPDGKPFAVCLTHDVDAVSEINPAQNFRSILHQLSTFRERSLSESIKWIIIHKLRLLKGLVSKEKSFCSFEEWMAMEEKHGARSTFFFAPQTVDRKHGSDCQYHYDQTIPFEGSRITVAELMTKLDAGGWEVGLHPSWHAHADVDEMRAQKKQIESCLNHEIQSVRQHFLKYDPLKTASVQAAAGFKYDSTLGFNDNIGFRRGTSYPYQLTAVDGLTVLPLMEIPLTLQDGALLLGDKGLRLDVDTALEYIKRMIASVKEVGGVLNLSWHPHTRTYPGFWDLYSRTLALLAAENPYFGTIAEIGSYWQAHANIDLLNYAKTLQK